MKQRTEAQVWAMMQINQADKQMQKKIEQLISSTQKTKQEMKNPIETLESQLQLCAMSAMRSSPPLPG